MGAEGLSIAGVKTGFSSVKTALKCRLDEVSCQ